MTTAGLPAAFAQYDAALRRYVARFVPVDAIDDVIGEVWLEAVKYAHDERPWLYRIAATRCWRWWRREKRKPALRFLDIPEDKMEFLGHDGGLDAVLQSCDTAMAAVLLRAALLTLHDHERQAVLLLAHRVPAPAAAHAMRLPLRTYQRLVARVLTKLATRMAGIAPRPAGPHYYARGETPATCQEDGCDRPYYSANKCRRCYDRARTSGRRARAVQSLRASL